MAKKKATFGAGCFWGVEAAFRTLPGVSDASVGYMGGEKRDPTYQDICTGTTGHAEVVEVEFSDDLVSFDDLLNLFWTIHDPTTPNRQGFDVGSQYRSAVFYHADEQRALAETSIKKLEENGRFEAPIVTEVTQAGPFYRAEEYHQRYMEKAGRVGQGFTCR